MRANRAAGKRGARRSSEAKERFWRDHVARQAAGGLTVRAYCRQHVLTEPSFYSWRRELARRTATTRNVAPPAAASTVGSRAARENALTRSASLPSATGPAPPAAAVEFVRLEVRPEPPLPHERIEIVLGDGAVVRVPRGADEATLRTVLAAAAMARGPSC